MDLARIFTSAGVPFVEVGPWRSHVRPGTFEPEGVLIHHTGSSGFDSTLRTVRYGREDLAGPLCNVFVARGACYIVSAGRANHAGTGDARVLERMRRGYPPLKTAKANGWTEQDVVGNGLLVGFEILAPGRVSAKIPDEDWDVATRGAAAVLRFLKRRTVARCIGHAEWTSRKVDPQLGHGRDAWENMARFRQQIAPLLKVTR